MSDDEMPVGEKLFWGLVVFLILKGLLDAKDANDRSKIAAAAQRHRQGLGPAGPAPSQLPFPVVKDPFRY